LVPDARESGVPAGFIDQYGVRRDGSVARYRISLDVLQNWEQHRNEPDPIARNVLEMIERNPVAAERALWGAE
jgi:DNA-binding transcriptional regulator YiaG